MRITFLDSRPINDGMAAFERISVVMTPEFAKVFSKHLSATVAGLRLVSLRCERCEVSPKKREPVRLPSDFEATVKAWLETPPPPRRDNLRRAHC